MNTELPSTSIVNLTANSDTAAKDQTRIKDMEDALLRSEYALHALAKETEQQKAELLHQWVTFDHQMETGKQHMQRELAAMWAAADKINQQMRNIKLSEKSTSTPWGFPS